MTLPVERFSVRELVDDLLETVAPLVRENDNTLTVQFADDVQTINGDVMKARLILSSLLNGAASFTRQGAITLEVREREDPLGAPCVEFTITDTGVGLTHDEVDRLFDDIDAFGRNDAPNPDLAMVWRSCQEMGGSVSLESRLYKGSRFTVLLPITSVAAGALDAWEMRTCARS